MDEALADLCSMTLSRVSKYPYPKSLEQKITTLRLSFKDEHQEELSRLLEEFSFKVKALGADIKAGDLPDIESLGKIKNNSGDKN